MAVCTGSVSCTFGRSGGPIVDCLTSPTPVCGNECDNPCGSGCVRCPYAPDVKWCSEGNVLHCPSSSCMEVVEVCPDTDACVASSCARSMSDCGAVREAYEAELGRSAVAVVREGSGGLAPGEYGDWCPAGCAVVGGDCEAGLETCWLVGSRTAELDRLATLYGRLGCPGTTVCNCPSVDVTVSCRGTSSPDGGFMHNACVAR